MKKNEKGRLYDRMVADLKSMWRCDGEAFVIAGSGTLAMEMAVSNVTKRGDSILICSHGFFGDRFIDMCANKGLAVDTLKPRHSRRLSWYRIRIPLYSDRKSVV